MCRPLAILLLLLMLLQACGGKTVNGGFRPADFTDIQPWRQADFSDTAEALRTSCASLRRAKSDSAIGGALLGLQYSDWQEICGKAKSLQDSDMQNFLETHFQPLFLQKPAFFTGYFEAHLNVSRKRDETYRFPVLAPPGHQTLATSVREDSLLWALKAALAEPFQTLPKNYDRRRIESESASGKFTVLFWGDSAIDLFLAQIQGSARVSLPDGTQKRIGFAAHNGYGYVSIGKYLLESERLKSLPDGWFSIRDYLQNHPQEAQDIMWQNPRYIFFRTIADNKGPYGRLNTPLIGNRSAAADHKLMPFGTPIWVEPQGPIGESSSESWGESERLILAPRLMFIHDTGSAIKGAGRTDLFFGAGEAALNIAARLRNSGKLYILVPKKYIQRVNFL